MSLAHARVTPLHTDVNWDEEPITNRRRRRRVEPAVLISVIAFVVLGAAMLHVGQRAKLAALTFELHQAQIRLEQAKRIQTQLIVEVERARSLERVEAEARFRLGMVRPTSSNWIVVHADPPAPPSVQHPQTTGQSIWITAISEWYDRVSAQVRTALPVPWWSQNSR